MPSKEEIKERRPVKILWTHKDGRCGEYRDDILTNLEWDDNWREWNTFWWDEGNGA
jgi:hypothetical protein